MTTIRKKVACIIRVGNNEDDDRGARIPLDIKTGRSLRFVYLNDVLYIRSGDIVDGRNLYRVATAKEQCEWASLNPSSNKEEVENK